MSAFVNGRRYSTDGSTLIASGEFDGGPAWLSKDKVTFLFRDGGGHYFAQFRMHPDPNRPHSERYWLEPLTELDAIPIYWELPEKLLPFAEAFGAA